VAESSDRYVYVVWQAYICSNNSVRYLYISVRNPSGVWSTPQQLTNFDTNGASVAVGSDGVVHIAYSRVWQTDNASGQALMPLIFDTQLYYTNSYNRGASFSIPTPLTDRDSNKANVLDLPGRQGYR